jgi:hypothetical protein
MVEPYYLTNKFDDLLISTQNHLKKTEIARKDLNECNKKFIELKFEKIQKLREKLKIESEKQKLLVGVFSKMKESEEGEKWESRLEDNENEYLKKQIDLLNLKLKIKCEELLQKKETLNERKLFIEQLDQKMTVWYINHEKPQKILPIPPHQKSQETISLQNFQNLPNPLTLQNSTDPNTIQTLPTLLNQSTQSTQSILSSPSTTSNPSIPSNLSNSSNPENLPNTNPLQIKTLKIKKVSIKLEPSNFFSNFS